MTTKTFMIAAAAAMIFAGTAFTATDAEAKRGGAATYYQTFETRRAERGYEGFTGVGAGYGNAYCSYHRKPNRKCWYSRRGREICKIVSWRLVQHCY